MYGNDNGTWHRVGDAPVDSGTMMLVDPCYVLKDKRDEGEPDNGLEYSEALGFDKPEEHPESYASRARAEKDSDWDKAFKLGGNAAGFFFPSGFGDGQYPVFARVKDFGDWGLRVTGVFIDFGDRDSELDEEDVDDEVSSAY